MTDIIFPLHTAVKHVRDGYTGWIHASTTMKDLFTGNKECKWQYTIRIEGETQLRVAPVEDLSWIDVNAPFPAYLIYKQEISDKKYLQETRLHALGYQISGLNSEERWHILKYVAIPMLGAKEVVRTIMAVVSSRTARPANADKFRNAFQSWNKDLNVVGQSLDGKEEAVTIRGTIGYVQKRLLDLKLIDKKDVLFVPVTA